MKVELKRMKVAAGNALLMSPGLMHNFNLCNMRLMLMIARDLWTEFTVKARQFILSPLALMPHTGVLASPSSLNLQAKTKLSPDDHRDHCVALANGSTETLLIGIWNTVLHDARGLASACSVIVFWHFVSMVDTI